MALAAFIRRINAELAAARKQWQRDRYRKALKRRCVVLPPPRDDDRSSITIHKRINTP